MSELLTTGQMLDELGHGFVAESTENLRVKNYPFVGVAYVDKENKIDRDKGLDGYFFINGDRIRTMKWRILPSYVSFEEAMKAGKKGKNIAFVDKHGERFHITSHELIEWNLKSLTVKNDGLLDLFEGKWSIEGNSDV